ncbi:MAG: hypothetical protein IKE03_07750, partial [Blautia sp.]|nr:hypothetical protein [Blautia sp.]
DAATEDTTEAADAAAEEATEAADAAAEEATEAADAATEEVTEAVDAAAEDATEAVDAAAEEATEAVDAAAEEATEAPAEEPLTDEASTDKASSESPEEYFDSLTIEEQVDYLEGTISAYEEIVVQALDYVKKELNLGVLMQIFGIDEASLDFSLTAPEGSTLEERLNTVSEKTQLLETVVSLVHKLVENVQ